MKRVEEHMHAYLTINVKAWMKETFTGKNEMLQLVQEKNRA